MIRVSFVDRMGDDLSVVNSARVSFNKQSDWVYETHDHVDVDSRRIEVWNEPIGLSDRDTKLIHFLARNNHFTPFTHTAITLHVKAPIFIRTQCFKHKVGLTENEVSRRYVKDEPEFFFPDYWRSKPEHSKQGSGEDRITFLRMQGFSSQSVEGAYDILIDHASDLYRDMIEAGVAPEQARMVLPQSMITEWYWTGSVAAFARVYNLRSAPDAQKEIQEVAHQIDEVIQPLFPVSWDALTTKENE